MIIRFAIGTLKHVAKAVGYGVVGALVMGIIAFVVMLEKRPDLKVWHEAELDAEFTTRTSVESFEEYLELEDRLFAQLYELVYSKIEADDKTEINRYHRGSRSDPGQWPQNWNRSFELPVEEPRAGVLLLHGLSDSPYSLRTFGERLHAAGAWVVGLRIPGHGTAPSGLTTARWQDMAAAVRLAVDHVSDKTAGQPLYVIGYSNGGALAVHYALATLEDDTLPAVDRMVLISPEIGVTRLAAFAVWQARLGYLLGLRKLEWNDLQPEYDPYKYGSFAVNAGDLAYRLTSEIQSSLELLGRDGKLDRFPPLLAFQSVVDATVSMPALVTGLFEKLPEGDHELVLFDLNRFTEIEHILKHDPKPEIAALLDDPARAFAVSVLTNETDETKRVVVRHAQPGQTDSTETRLGIEWPKGLYSLAHVALPFSPDDPVYGSEDTGDGPHIHLGRIDLRGERGVLQIPASAMLRLRWNPFFPYMERRTFAFFDL